jgi:hypothetical protein
MPHARQMHVYILHANENKGMTPSLLATEDTSPTIGTCRLGRKQAFRKLGPFGNCLGPGRLPDAVCEHPSSPLLDHLGCQSNGDADMQGEDAYTYPGVISCVSYRPRKANRTGSEQNRDNLTTSYILAPSLALPCVTAKRSSTKKNHTLSVPGVAHTTLSAACTACEHVNVPSLPKRYMIHEPVATGQRVAPIREKTYK